MESQIVNNNGCAILFGLLVVGVPLFSVLSVFQSPWWGYVFNCSYYYRISWG